jgi:hypothetical protein
MNSIPKEKRKSLILVILVTVGVLSGIWFGLVSMQKGSLKRVAADKTSASRKLSDMVKVIESADQVETELTETRATLTKVESGMASGDLLSWTINPAAVQACLQSGDSAVQPD